MKSRENGDFGRPLIVFRRKGPETGRESAEEAFCNGLDLLHASSEIQSFHRNTSISDNVEQFGSSMFECRKCEIRVPGFGPSLHSLGTEILPASDARPGYENAHLSYEELSQLPME